jgi:hypothetical protein
MLRPLRAAQRRTLLSAVGTGRLRAAQRRTLLSAVRTGQRSVLAAANRAAPNRAAANRDGRDGPGGRAQTPDAAAASSSTTSRIFPRTWPFSDSPCAAAASSQKNRLVT